MLTKKQEQFVQNILKGMSQIDAYKDAYNAEKMTDNSISREASLLLKNPKVSQRLKELQDEAAKGAVLTAQERMEYLSRVITGKEPERKTVIVEGEKFEIECSIETKEKLKAVDILNKMSGEYVTKVEGTVKMKLEDLL